MIKSYLVTWGSVNHNLDNIISQIDNYEIINSDAPENPDWHNLGLVWYFKQFHFAITDFIENSSEDIMCWYATDATTSNLRDIFTRAKQNISGDVWIYAPHFTHEAWGQGATNIKPLLDGLHYASQTDGIMVFFSREMASLMKEYMDYLASKEKLEEMKSGWGLDYVWSTLCIYHEKYILRDLKFVVHHPEGSSYNHDAAAHEMGIVLKRFHEFCKLKGFDADAALAIKDKIAHKLSDNSSAFFINFYKPLESTIPYHIVSVDEKRKQNKDRIDLIMGEDNRINIECLDARDPEKLKSFMVANKDFKLGHEGFKLGEIGCFASHYLAWQYLANSDLDELIIFEDDAWLGDDFVVEFSERMKLVPKGYDVFSIYVDANQFDRYASRHVVNELVSRGYQDWSTLAYIVSKNGAAKLLEHFSEVGVDQPVDWYIFRNGELGIFDVYTTSPGKSLPLHINDMSGSQVQTGRTFTELDLSMSINFDRFIQERGASTYSQLQQDIFALFICGEKPGFFVEFGACDGIHLSNTYILEKDYGWTGILSEPLPSYFNELKKNRSASLSQECVYNVSGEEISFTEVDLDSDKGLSGISQYAFQDHHAPTRVNSGSEVMVQTISLDDLLDKYNAPEIIEYLSVDTEGSELMILEAFSFNRQFKFISVEHNGTGNREKIFSLLTSKGYDRILTEHSKWDDWYIKKDLL